jgi:ferredoxin
MSKNKRKIVNIDEDKCNGCGVCVIACAEGALRIINGKARLISDTYCDGLGACLGECPQGAITIEERPAAGFKGPAPEPCGCPGSAVQELRTEAKPPGIKSAGIEKSQLASWPVQLTLVPPDAPFLKKADILLTADCVPVAYAGFHRDFIAGRVVLVACPKLDDFEAHKERLVRILKTAGPKNLTVVHMEVPCCSGLVLMAREAIKESGVKVPLNEITVSVRGEII